MASEQVHREAERAPSDQKRIVPEIKAHIESMSGKKSVNEGNQEQLSLNEVKELRQKAQQNSADTLRAAHERYDLLKSKEESEGSGGLTKTAREVKERSADMTRGARDTVANAGMAVKDKMVAAKDVTVESGVGAAHYAGEMALDAKDRAVAAGWTAVHYTTEKAVDGTKAAAKAVQGVAEYAAELASRPLGAAKQAAEATSESMKEYTFRKKEEARREVEARTHQTPKVEGEGEYPYGGKNGSEGEQKQEQCSVFGAIGETIKEIAQTTQEMVLGQHPEDQNEPDKEFHQ